MERETDKHGPRVDEGLKDEGERPVVAGREEELPDDALTDAEVKHRTNLGRFIEGAAFPGTREEIIASAEQMDAPPEVLAELKGLPEGTYEGFPKVWEALGGRVEGGRKHGPS